MLVAVYLAAIVAANVSAATWGPEVTILNALLFIGLDLSLRDKLHHRWMRQAYLEHRPRRAWLRMGALIAAGGVLSYVAVPAAGPIATASAVAWVLAGAVDAVVYHVVYGFTGKGTRAVMASNTVSAGVDSLVFPTLAFGALLPAVVLGQWLAKVVGGALWMWAIRRVTR